MKFAFFGTDAFAVKVLATLKETSLVPSLIITNPDKPVGRKQIITPPPAKVWALENNIPIIQPASLKEIPEELKAGFDVFITASYGKIIPQNILDLPPHNCLNIHPSLLPKYRGPAPLEYTILNDDSETGVTIMQMDSKMDEGPILATAKVTLDGTETYFDLREQLAELGAKTLTGILPDYLAGNLKPIEQNHTEATYTKLITKEDGEINPATDPLTAWHKYRAFIEWPGVYFFDTPKPGEGGKGKRIIVKKARFENGKLIIERVVPEGKTEIDWLNP